MICGSQLGDLIFQAAPEGRTRFLLLFGGAALLGTYYLASVLFLTRRDVHERPLETPAAHHLILRYWPGYVALVAIMLGFGITVITVFLTRFATQLGLSGIRTFFAAYSISALMFRVPATRWSRTIGRHRMILLGLAGNGIGHALLPFVTLERHFLIPAVACGFGHALLFPAVLSLGAGRFPRHYRGSGTTIVLGFTEVGAMISAPLFGWIIDNFDFATMFYSASGCTFSVALLYALTAARQPDYDIDEVIDVPAAAAPSAAACATPAIEVETEPACAPAGARLAPGTCLDK